MEFEDVQLDSPGPFCFCLFSLGLCAAHLDLARLLAEEHREHRQVQK